MRTIADENDKVLCLGQFPSEINQRIFSGFSRSECVECMRVCRLWRARMPEWSVDQWRALEIRNNDLDEMQPILSIIGTHVRRVTVSQPSEKSASTIIDKLVSLGLVYADTFMLAVEGQYDLVALPTLELFSRHLTRLDVGSTRSDCHLLDILDCCPQLTHFASSSQARFSPNYQGGRRVSPLPLQIQYLRLAHEIGTDELALVLRHSPQLRHLRLQLYRQLDLVEIVDMCPELAVLSSGYFPSIAHDPLWTTEGHKQQQHPRMLQVSNVHCESPLQHMLAVLNTPWGFGVHRLVCEISELYASNSAVAWPQFTTSLPHLKEFRYVCENYGSVQALFNPLMETLVLPMLAHCKASLQDVDIQVLQEWAPVDHGPAGHDAQATAYYAAFSQLQDLRHLCIHESNGNCFSDLRSLFSRILAQQTPLTSFEYMYVHTGRSYYFPEFAPLARIPTLRHVTLRSFLSRNGCWRTVSNAIEYLSDSGSIDSLHFHGFEAFEDNTVYKHVCQMPRLKYLTISGLELPPSLDGIMYLAEHHKSLELLCFKDVPESSRMQDIVRQRCKKLVLRVKWET